MLHSLFPCLLSGHRTVRRVPTGYSRSGVQHISCQIAGIIYLIQCSACNVCYVALVRLASPSVPGFVSMSTMLLRIVAPAWQDILSHCSSQQFWLFGVEIAINSNKRKLKEKQWIYAPSHLHLQGLNVVSLSTDVTKSLVLPFRRCAKSVNDLCRNLCSGAVRVLKVWNTS